MLKKLLAIAVGSSVQVLDVPVLVAWLGLLTNLDRTKMCTNPKP